MSGEGRMLTHQQAKAFYDRLGSKQDLQAFYEVPATTNLIAHAAFEVAQSVFECGCGTGAFAELVLAHHLSPQARYLAVDSSATMVALARTKLARRRRREEQQLIEQAGKVIRQLESWGEPVSPGGVCELMGISRARLRTHPRLKALVDQHCGNGPESRQRSREREAELVKRVEAVIAQLASRGEPVTQQRVCKSVGLTQRYLERYPLVTRSDQHTHSARESHHTERLAQNGAPVQDRGEKVSAGANHS